MRWQKKRKPVPAKAEAVVQSSALTPPTAETGAVATRRVTPPVKRKPAPDPWLEEARGAWAGTPSLHSWLQPERPMQGAAPEPLFDCSRFTWSPGAE